MPAATRTRARLRVVNNLGELHGAMDDEDDEFGPTIKVESIKSGSSSSDSDSDDPAGEEDDADDKLVDEVKNADTHKDTKHGYRLSLQRFIVFLYVKRAKKEKYQVLHKDLVVDLRKVKGGSAKQSNLNSRRRAVAMTHILRAGPEYQPIDLSQLDPQVFLSFLLSITNAKKKEYNKSYGGHRSALTHLFTMCEVSPSASFQAKMKRYMAGLKNTSAAARGEKGDKLGEGKEPLPFEVYRALCKWLLEEGDAESIFGHCFLTTTWNLMCRSRNTVFVRLEHMGWDNDAMTIQFAHTKTDRAGKDDGYKRHIYANPDIPEICPIASVARYRMAFPTTEYGYLFPGSSQYDRFRKLLGRIIKQHDDEIRRMGIDPANIGVHSIRKGAATYCCNGTTAGVSFAAVCVRAGWTMGNVKDRYLQHQAAGDQVCGRTVAGLDVNSERFSISPPHFLIKDAGDDDEGSDDDANSTTNGCTGDDVDDAVALVFGSVPQTWKLLSWYLLASLLFHRSFFTDTVKVGSRLRGCVLFRRGLFDTVLESARTCFPWENKNHVLWRVVFTGIPPSVTGFNFHKQQLEILLETPDRVVFMMKSVLDDRAIGGGDLTMDRMRKELFEPWEKNISNRLDTLSGSMAKTETKVPSKSPVQPFSWGNGLFRSVPKDYELNTKLSSLDAWICWHLGEEKKGASTDSSIEYSTPPWKSLATRDLKPVISQRTYLSNLKFICESFDKAAGLTTHSKPDISELRRLHKSESIQSVIQSVGVTATGRKRRVDQIKWETLARELRKPKGAGTNLKKRKADSKKYPTHDKKKQARRIKSTAAKGGAEIDFLGSTTQGYRMSPPKRTKKDIVKQNKKKEKRRQASQAAGSVLVPGPIPTETDTGFLVLPPFDLMQINTQGNMLTGAATTGYLNLLTRQHYHAGVRRTSDNFVSSLQTKLAEHGSQGSWAKHMEQVNTLKVGDHDIDWENDPIIFIQVFRGEPECGHWALLVVDRTVDKNGRLVFIDSLPNMYRDTMSILQNILSGTPLAPKGCKWIRANMPKQGVGTMDCGVFMCCMAGLYVKETLSRGRLSTKSKAADFTNVNITFKGLATTVGGAARDHMISALRLGLCDLEAQVFNLCSIEWPELMDV